MDWTLRSLSFVFHLFFSHASVAVGMKAPAFLAVLTENYPFIPHIIVPHAQGFYVYKSSCLFLLISVPH